MSRLEELDPRRTAEDFAEASLRPRRLEEFIGQDKVRANLAVFLQAALQRSEPLDHLLLYGPHKVRVKARRKPATCVPPSIVLMLFT